MKLFNKFKQLNREIKLIIITALIASCIGVYATGECIISATADDVSYNNTTVQAAIDDLFSMSTDYCPPGYECEKNNLYAKMEKQAVLDNIASTYVTSSTGIDFSNISSDTNGKGVYEIASTKNDPYPIYYYRGAVNNNNVKFAGFCWKAIRTTDTGGVKMIYNGEPDQDGYCTNTTGESTQIDTGPYDNTNALPVNVGYMYSGAYSRSTRQSSNLATPYIYGNDVTYSNGTYTLTDTMTSTGTWTTDYNTFNNHHYTCFSTGNTCTRVYYIYYTSATYTDSYARYITLTNGKKVEDALDDMFNGSTTNQFNSTIKNTIDTWYNTNLSSYTAYIEDTVYCNDRSISSIGSWDPDGGDVADTNSNNSLKFKPNDRVFSTYKPTLECSRQLDRFTVSSTLGNGALTYPVGLITVDEMMYAGGRYDIANSTYYLYTNQLYWGMSPLSFGIGLAYESVIYANGKINGYYIYSSTSGYRPVISISPTAELESGGDGTTNNPYVIKTR